MTTTTNVVELDRPGVGNLQAIGDDRAAVKRRLALSYPDERPGTIAAWAGVLLRFAYGSELGDFVVHPERATQTVSIGRIIGDYRFTEPGLHQRDVTWLIRRRSRAQLSDGARKDLSARVAFFAVRGSADEFLALAAHRR